MFIRLVPQGPILKNSDTSPLLKSWILSFIFPDRRMPIRLKARSLSRIQPKETPKLAQTPSSTDADAPNLLSPKKTQQTTSFRAPPCMLFRDIAKTVPVINLVRPFHTAIPSSSSASASSSPTHHLLLLLPLLIRSPFSATAVVLGATTTSQTPHLPSPSPNPPLITATSPPTPAELCAATRSKARFENDNFSPG